MKNEFDLDTLRRGFALRTPGSEVTDMPHVVERCPEDGQIYDAANGYADVDQRRNIVAHTATCATCAESWRMARGLGQMALDNPHSDQAPHAFKPQRAKVQVTQWLAGAAVAAVLLLAVGISLYEERPGEVAPIMRSGAQGTLSSTVAGALDAQQEITLQWQLEPQVEGVTYQVKVTTEDIFNVIFQVRDLNQSSVTIPAEALANVPSGSQIIWQVIATYPDGTSQKATFVNEIQ